MRVYKAKECSQCGKMFIPTGTKQKKCRECRDVKSVNIKKCRICGKEFVFKRNYELYCSLKCKEDFRLYYDNSTLENVYIKENDRQIEPSEEYLKEVNYMLKDFQIEIDIPDFKTVAELDKWKKDIIKKFL